MSVKNLDLEDYRLVSAFTIPFNQALLNCKIARLAMPGEEMDEATLRESAFRLSYWLEQILVALQRKYWHAFDATVAAANLMGQQSVVEDIPGGMVERLYHRNRIDLNGFTSRLKKMMVTLASAPLTLDVVDLATLDEILAASSEETAQAFRKSVPG